MTSTTTAPIIEEVKNATFGNFSINETAIAVFTLTGPGLDDLSAADRDDLHTMLSFWKYGAEHGGGEPVSTWSAEKLADARAFIAAHQLSK
jgi:hypothetical protein